MKVTVEHDNKFTAILSEPEFGLLLNIVHGNKQALYFLARVITRYRDANELEHGPASSGLSIDRFIEVLSAYTQAGAGVVPDSTMRKIADILIALYDRHDPGHVRSAILEGLVEERLRERGRYPGHLLENNVVVIAENGTPYSRLDQSTSSEGHLLGRSPRLQDARQVVLPAWIAELESELFPRGFEIGLVTADGYRNALNRLKDNGVVRRNAQILPLEQLWDFAPLR